MATGDRFSDRRSVIAAAITAVTLLVGAGVLFKAITTPGPPPQPDANQTAAPAAPAAAPDTSGPAVTSLSAPASSPTSTSAASGAAPDFGPLLGASTPVALTIASIGLRTDDIVGLGLDDGGKLEAPADFDRAGWYTGGPTPGELGPSVIGAHVDSKAGPAVFYRLGTVKQGDTASVAREDGSTATFAVDRVERYAKADFPTATVYGDTGGRAELRLITCGGAFDQSTGHYVDNIVVFAHLVA